MTASGDDLAFIGFAARMALLMARGDESGIESLTRVFVRANTGSAGSELVDELMDLARSMVAAFERQDPGLLESTLAGHEQGIADEFDGGDQ